MTLTLLRRKAAPLPRRRIVAVSDSWRLDGDEFRRVVTVREPDGRVRPVLLADDHPALVRYLTRVAA